MPPNATGRPDVPTSIPTACTAASSRAASPSRIQFSAWHDLLPHAVTCAPFTADGAIKHATAGDLQKLEGGIPDQQDPGAWPFRMHSRFARTMRRQAEVGYRDSILRTPRLPLLGGSSLRVLMISLSSRSRDLVNRNFRFSQRKWIGAQGHSDGRELAHGRGADFRRSLAGGGD